MRKILALAALVAGAVTPLAAQRRPAQPAPRPTGYWQESIGLSAGFTDTYQPSSQQSIMTFAGPLTGSDPALAAGGFGSIPTLFAIFPIGGRLAVEPGFDLRNYSTTGNGVTAVTLAGRLDYAFSHFWYGAVGGAVSHVSATGSSGQTRAGGSLAVGARFHLTGPLGGRFEIGYSFLGQSDLIAATQTMSYLFAMTVPLR